MSSPSFAGAAAADDEVLVPTWAGPIGITIGFTPLGVPGDDLNEPPDTTNGIENNLSLALAPYFDNGKVVVSPSLERNAKIGYNNIRTMYGVYTVPKKVVSSTLPVGAGNRWGGYRRAFFPKGATIEN